jgi:quinol monooxygenase YgiN
MVERCFYGRRRPGLALRRKFIMEKTMSMPEIVTVTVSFAVKPELADSFVETIRRMFLDLPQHKGFQNNRLLRSDADPNQFLMIEDWDEAQDFYNYVQFRTERGEMAALGEMTASPPLISVWALKPLASVQASKPVMP